MGSGASSFVPENDARYHISKVPVSVGPAQAIVLRRHLRSSMLSFARGLINSVEILSVDNDIAASDHMDYANAFMSRKSSSPATIPQLDIPEPPRVASPPPARNTGMRASAVMMAKFILDTVPDFKSYSDEDPTSEDLAMANTVRQLLSSPSKYLEFYTTVYEILYDSSTMRSFPIRTITFKNMFLSELMKLIVSEGSSKTSFADKVQNFGIKYKAEGIDIAECKRLHILQLNVFVCDCCCAGAKFFHLCSLLPLPLRATTCTQLLTPCPCSFCSSIHFKNTDGQFGEAIITAMRKVQKQDAALWPRVYSRFLRTLVPYMIVQISKAIIEVSANAVRMDLCVFYTVGVCSVQLCVKQHSTCSLLLCTLIQNTRYRRTLHCPAHILHRSSAPPLTHPHSCSTTLTCTARIILETAATHSPRSQTAPCPPHTRTPTRCRKSWPRPPPRTAVMDNVL